MVQYLDENYSVNKLTLRTIPDTEHILKSTARLSNDASKQKLIFCTDLFERRLRKNLGDKNGAVYLFKHLHR